MKDLMKKLMKVEDGGMKDHERQSKMEALQELIREMDAIIGGDMEAPEEMQEVTVAAKDPAALAEGLEKAEDIIKKMPMQDMGNEGMEDDTDDMY